MPATPDIRLDHLHVPARRPDWLAEWYANMFGFAARDNFVFANSLIMVFETGKPVDYAGHPHFGFRCGSREQVAQWAEKLEVTLDAEDEYCGFRTKDPEGNHFEVYWEAS